MSTDASGLSSEPTAVDLLDIRVDAPEVDTDEAAVTTVEDEMSLRVAPVPLSCATARAAVRGFFEEQRFDDYVDTAELLTSELVTNAIRYARSPVTVAGRRAGSGLVIDVTGDGGHRPVLEPLLPDDDAERGRGLFVVEALAGAWGTRYDDGEVTVWFRLP